MRYPTLAIIAISALSASANPLPVNFESPACLPCRRATEYNVTHQYEWKTSPILLRGYSCTSTSISGCELQEGREYSVSIGTDIGFNLGLEFSTILGIATEVAPSFGVSKSWSETETSALARTATVICPNGLRCGFLHQDAIVVMQGYKKEVERCPACSGGGRTVLSDDYYVITVPMLGEDNVPVSNVMACACPDSDMSNRPSDMYICPESCDSGKTQ